MQSKQPFSHPSPSNQARPSLLAGSLARNLHQVHSILGQQLEVAAVGGQQGGGVQDHQVHQHLVACVLGGRSDSATGSRGGELGRASQCGRSGACCKCCVQLSSTHPSATGRRLQASPCTQTPTMPSQAASPTSVDQAPALVAARLRCFGAGGACVDEGTRIQRVGKSAWYVLIPRSSHPDCACSTCPPAA